MSNTSKTKEDSALEENQVFSSSDDNPKNKLNSSEEELNKIPIDDTVNIDQKEEINEVKVECENEEVTLNDKLLKVENEAKKNFELMLRAKAELENYKKRVAREMSDLRKYATESLMKELLSVVDNLERALESSKSSNIESISEGINLTLNETIKLLSKHNVTPIKSIGKVFDPKIHQAMSQEETSIYPKNTIIKEFLKGYLLHERLLRPAMVVVSKEPEKNDS